MKKKKQACERCKVYDEQVVRLLREIDYLKAENHKLLLRATGGTVYENKDMQLLRDNS